MTFQHTIRPTRLAVLLIMLLVTPAARAEVFVLHAGGRVDGRWLNPDDKERGLYEIETLGGGRITLAASQVKDILVLTEGERKYRALLPHMPNTLDGHWKMAEWCEKTGLKKEREIHLRKVIELEPNHSDARHALGFSRVNGRWIRPDQWLADQGYVRYKGSWKLPQEVELAAEQERRSVEEKQWRKRIRVWRAAIVRGNSDSRASVASIQSIDSHLAVTALVELLDDQDEPVQLKLLYISVLDRFPSFKTFGALMRRVMRDGNQEVVERCLASLRKHGSDEAVTMLSKSLKEKDNRAVNQAAWALGQLGNRNAVPALIEAITTKHRFLVQTGSGGPGNTSAGFSPTSGNSFSSGPSKKLIEREVQNQKVLKALTLLTPEGVNFGYNKAAWKNWFAVEQTKGFVNLRRDL